MKSIKIIYSLFLTLLFLNQAKSQVNQEWATTFNGVGNTNDLPAAMVSDGLGNVIVTGRTSASAPTSNFCTVKYNSSGVQQWAAIYNGPENNNDLPLCLAADDSGNVYVAGIVLNTISYFDIVLVKYNPSGIQQWAQSWTGSGYFRDMPNAMTKDAFGNIYLTGQSANATPTGNNYITLKYSSGGVLQWAKQHSGGKASCIETDASGNIYVTGDLILTADFLTIKYNSLGDSLWVRRYGTSTTQENVAGLAIDLNGNCYITGTKITGGTDFDFLTLKYDPSGNFQWAINNDSGNTAEDLEVDVLGNVYVTGSTAVGGSGNIATIKYNTGGIHQWIAIYNYLPEVLGDNVKDLELDGLGNIYIVGDISKVSGTDHDIITVKYNNSGVQQWAAQYDVLDFEYPFDLVLDANNNVYVTASQESYGGNADFVTIKYSQSGSLLTLSLTAFIEGFYNSVSDNMISDTARVYLRNAFSPFAKVDSSKGILSSSGTGTFLFSNAVNGVGYYLAVKHRNSIETWSSSPVTFTSGSSAFNFTTVSTQAYGSNMKQVDSSPLKFAMFSGDNNQDGFVNLTDVIDVYNAASSFTDGYVSSDMNGDDISDLADVIITNNNSNNFVSVERP